jgi:dihydrofolate reductase
VNGRRATKANGPTDWIAPRKSPVRVRLAPLQNLIPKLKDEVEGDLFMHGSGEFAYALAEKGLIDEYEVYLNPLVWGKGNVHVLGDRGTVRMELDDMKRFDSGVVLLTYLPAS